MSDKKTKQRDPIKVLIKFIFIAIIFDYLIMFKKTI